MSHSEEYLAPEKVREWLRQSCLFETLVICVIGGIALAIWSKCGIAVPITIDGGVIFAGLFLGRKSAREMFCSNWSERQLIRSSLMTLVLISMVTIVLYLAALFAASKGHPLISQASKGFEGMSCHSETTLLLLLAAQSVLLAPLAETIIFQGWIQSVIGGWPGMLISSIAFAAGHEVTNPMIWGGALLFGILRMKGMPLLPLCVAHILNNAPFSAYLLWAALTAS